MKTSTTRIAGIAAATLGFGLMALPLAVGASASDHHGDDHGDHHGESHKVGICHATSSDTNPFTWIVVDKDSVKYKGHLEHRTEPNKTWKDAGVWNGVEHAAGAAKADYIEGIDAGVTKAWCLAEVAPVVDPTDDPTDEPTDTPTDDPTDTPTDEPTDTPTDTPTDEPTDTPTDEPTDTPTDEPTEPVVDPTDEPVVDPTDEPVVDPTDVPSDSAVDPGTEAPGTIPSTGGQPQLAHTGSASGVLLGLGGALLATGAVFVLAGRKPQHG